MLPSDLAPLGPYLRLLWNVTPALLHAAAPPADSAEADATPFLSRRGLHLPAAPSGLDTVPAGQWLRAAAAHAAAHLVFSRSVFVRAGMAPITQALLGLLEDARVEALACRELPGLRRLWSPWHTVTPADGSDFETLMLRLARALIDPAYDDPHPWVCKGRARFYLDAGGEVLAQVAPRALRKLASALGNDIGQMRIGFNARLYRPGPSYRDDNRWLWHSDGEDAGAAQAASGGACVGDRSAAELPPESLQWRYSEWDRRIARERRDWSTVTETLAVEAATTEHPRQAVDARLVRELRASALQARAMRPREREGDEIDLDAAVQTLLWVSKGGMADDARVHWRRLRAPARTAVMLLIDVSTSSGEPHTGGDAQSGLELQQHIAAALTAAMSAAGWRVAIQAFCSDGRHDVQHSRVLDFGQPWDDSARRRLAGLKPGLSTRLGAALRHAARTLVEEPATRRFTVVLGDGEPHDIDIHEPGYLADDARHAVQTARLIGVRSLCLVSASSVAPAVRRIFGVEGSAAASGIDALPRLAGRLLR
ncbi:hypothetical protein QTH87_23700 [Variovorax sp. J22P168]|uniref:nitric oxide reductase activation protein NorD n=1 Tax=Variovorax jilinensis TaxID=3053513 RepID=UPI002575FD80|nr:hypothetical protein [Variovorax sp. J22P168]MDM0015469.1 hypothetical protein [Variovorax sp. J22P168]